MYYKCKHLDHLYVAGAYLLQLDSAIRFHMVRIKLSCKQTASIEFTMYNKDRTKRKIIFIVLLCLNTANP